MDKNTQELYAKLAEQRLDSKRQLLDAAGIVFATNEMEEVERSIYETIFTPRDSFRHIPVSTEYNPAARSITYEVAERTGVANTMSRNADDRNRADVFLARHSVTVEEGGASYDYTVDNQNVRELTNFDLASERAKAAALMVAEWHDNVALNGYDIASGATGFANNADIATAKATQTWTSGTTTGDTMYVDIAGAINKIAEGSDGAHNGNSCALPITVWNVLAITPFNASSDLTVLGKLRMEFPEVTFTKWAKLKDQGAGSTNRVIAYEKNPTNMVYRATVIYDEDLPVRGNFKFKVDARGRSAGVTVRYPLAAKYQDITLSGY